LIAGKFRVDRILGKGGMGVVLAATHVHLGHRVAIKVLQPEHARSSHVVERFVREARAAATLRGENICRVTDVGALEDGAPYIVMELLDGTDLARVLATQGPVPVSRAASYVLEACVGVAEAHAYGIVHRDLKPANLFIAHGPDGSQVIKVLDFGIAKSPEGTNDDFSLTRTDSVLGSPGYMSPEQLRSSRDVDLRTDIWSLGVILFELVSGRRPFIAQTITELAIKVTMDKRPPFQVAMPPGFDQVIDRCLAKDPTHRFADLGSLAQALAPYAGGDGRELSTTVNRMLQGVQRPSTPVGIANDVAPTVPPTGFAGDMIYANIPTDPVPTTLGSSVRSIDTTPQAPRGRRGGVIIGLGIGMFAVVVSAAIFFGVRGSSGESTRPAKPPESDPGVVIDSAVIIATPPPPPVIDAAIAVTVDAAEPVIDATEVTVTVDAAAPADAGTKRKPVIQTRKPKEREKEKEDWGERRE
jgi:eukaryotic-like serine/threonine-protein kinase